MGMFSEAHEEQTWYLEAQLTEAHKQIARLERRIAELEKRNSDMSWELNPDRSGGAFTQQEIDESRRGGHGW